MLEGTINKLNSDLEVSRSEISNLRKVGSRAFSIFQDRLYVGAISLKESFVFLEPCPFALD